MISAIFITGEVSTGLCLINLPLELALLMGTMDCLISSSYLYLFLNRMVIVRQKWLKIALNLTNKKRNTKGNGTGIGTTKGNLNGIDIGITKIHRSPETQVSHINVTSPPFTLLRLQG